MKPDSEQQLVTLVRWIIFIPGAFAGGIATGFVFPFLLRARGAEIDFNSDWYWMMVANGLSGFVQVWTAAWLAPSTKKTIPTTVLAVLGFAFAGHTMFLAAAQAQWIKMGDGVAFMIGSAVALIAVIKSDTVKEYEETKLKEPPKSGSKPS